MNLWNRLFGVGIHPQEGMGGKAATSIAPIGEPPKPVRVIIPLRQHIGAPAKCLVQAGDYVRIGQKIGEANGFVSAAVHATVSGHVIGCVPCIMPDGTEQDAVIIENDFQEQWADLSPVENPESLTAVELADIARNAGIVGLGGATFPQAVKLSPPEGIKIDTLLLNGAECEPYLSADHRLMLEKAAEIVKGALLIRKVMKIDKVIIGVEKNKMDAVEALRAECAKHENIKTVALPSRYPQGEEKRLVYSLTRRVVKLGGLPLDIGVVVMNVGSVFALYRAVFDGRPLVQRVVSVAGCVGKPSNYMVRIGTPVEYLLDSSGGLLPSTRMLVYGGPMMGMAISRYDIPVTKSCSGIVALDKLSALAEEEPCIRCGRCVDACSVRLAPSTIDRFMRKDMYDEAEKLNVLACMECGVCSWSCPAKRNLTQSMRVCKVNIRKRKAEAARREKEKEAN